MITTKKLQYRDLIQRISEESIAKFYLGVGINKFFNAFFRKDPNPSARLYYYNGRIWYKDFGGNSMTLSDLIMRVKGWSYMEFLDHIEKDFTISNTTATFKRKITKRTANKHTILNVKYREWEPWDLEYWGSGGITKEWLEFANIRPIQFYWINGRTCAVHKWSYTYDCYWDEQVYRRKVYQPLIEDKSKKWISNINKTVLTGWDTIPKGGGGLIVTASSYKDSGVIQCNLTELNSRKMLPSFAPNTENSLLPEKIIPKVKSRFKRWIVWFDNDYAGMMAGLKYKQIYGCEPIFIPNRLNAKDPFEYRSKYGEEDFVKLSKYLMYNKL